MTATGTEDPAGIAAAVDQARLWDRLMRMAEFGALPNFGVNRQALSREDIAARHQPIAWAAARGFPAAVDGIGNLFVGRRGTSPPAPAFSPRRWSSWPTGRGR